MIRLMRILMVVGLLFGAGCIPTAPAPPDLLKELVAKVLPWCHGECARGIEDPAWPVT